MEVPEASGSIANASPSEAIVSLLAISKGNMGDFHQPVRRQGVWALRITMGSKHKQWKAGEMRPEAKETLSMGKGGKI